MKEKETDQMIIVMVIFVIPFLAAVPSTVTFNF